MANVYEHEFHQYKVELAKEAAAERDRIDNMVAMDFHSSPQFPNWELYERMNPYGLPNLSSPHFVN